jgi:hypothetical protein
MVWGGVKLVRAASGENNARRVSWLAVLTLGLPVTWMFPLLYTQKWVLPSFLPVGFFLENNIPESLPYGLGLAWLLMIGWLTTYQETHPR